MSILPQKSQTLKDKLKPLPDLKNGPDIFNYLKLNSDWKNISEDILFEISKRFGNNVEAFRIFIGVIYSLDIAVMIKDAALKSDNAVMSLAHISSALTHFAMQGLSQYDNNNKEMREGFAYIEMCFESALLLDSYNIDAIYGLAITSSLLRNKSEKAKNYCTLGIKTAEEMLANKVLGEIIEKHEPGSNKAVSKRLLALRELLSELEG